MGFETNTALSLWTAGAISAGAALLWTLRDLRKRKNNNDSLKVLIEKMEAFLVLGRTENIDQSDITIPTFYEMQNLMNMALAQLPRGTNRIKSLANELTEAWAGYFENRERAEKDFRSGSISEAEYKRYFGSDHRNPDPYTARFYEILNQLKIRS